MTTPNDHQLPNQLVYANTGGMDTWKKAGENLVKHRGGVYYLRAKVAGKIVRISLETSDLRTAKRKRDTKLEMLRKAASREIKPNDIHTLGDALELVAAKVTGRHGLKAKTLEYYLYMFTKMRATMPGTLAGSAWDEIQAAAWWKAFHGPHNQRLANTALQTARKIGTALVDAGLRATNPAAKLQTCRVAKTNVTDLPSAELMDTIIANVRNQKQRCSTETSQMIEFLAWSGMRINELRSLLWEDIGEQWITVTGGKVGTKNMEIRRLPLNPRLASVLKTRRPTDPADATGQVFSILTPRCALNNVCTRLKIRHLRVHDLRHWFASHAIESGVDIPTVARWLGHKDGGVLVMKTYGHIHDDHSLRSMEKMR